jgi:hypothetical protein
VQESSAQRDLDGALVRLVESLVAAVQPPAPATRDEAETSEAASGTLGMSPEQARELAQALAIGLRELVRAPLREALQAGYDLGYRAAQQAQERAVLAEVGPAVPAGPRADPLAPTAVSDTGPANHESAPAAPESAATALRDGSNEVLIEVGPFPSFSAVNRFHAAVAAAPEVADATIVNFRDGQLALRVLHPDSTALASALIALGLGPLRVVHAERDRLELALTPPTATQRAGRGPGEDDTLEMDRPPSL